MLLADSIRKDFAVHLNIAWRRPVRTVVAALALAFAVLFAPTAAHAESGYVHTAATSFPLKWGLNTNPYCKGRAWIGYTDTGYIEVQTYIECVSGHASWVKNSTAQIDSPRLRQLKQKHTYCGSTTGSCSSVTSIAASSGREYCNQAQAAISNLNIYSGGTPLCIRT
jgi:hypothetical protein